MSRRGHATSWVPAAAQQGGSLEEFKDQMNTQLREATMVKPSGRMDLNPSLGYPDFEPATAEKDEDMLTDKRLREGFYDTAAGLYTLGAPSTEEHGSMEEKFGQQDLKDIRDRLRLPSKEMKPRRVKHKCTTFPEPEYTGANHMDQWLKDLASAEQPLVNLAKQVPYMGHAGSSRGTELLRRLSELQVPLLRAVWFVKVTLLKEKNDRLPPAVTAPTDAVDREAEQRLADSWTDVVTSYMHEHFMTFANSKGKCDSGIQVEKLVGKWVYLVRFADWCYHEGILSRGKYLYWVLQEFQNAVIKPSSAEAWSAELMLPLIVNVFPDLCRLRTEVPELIRVCVNRYMTECMALTPAGPAPPAQPQRHDTPAPPAHQPPQPGQPTPMQQTPQEQAGGGGMGGGGPGASASGAGGGVVVGGGVGGVGGVGSQALLVNLRKCVQSLLVVHPEAFLALHPEVQLAWRLVESDAPVHDSALLKAALRRQHPAAQQVSSAWLSAHMPWADAELRARPAAGESPSWFHMVEALDRCCAGRGACDPALFREHVMPKPALVAATDPQRWHKVFSEHHKAPVVVHTVFGWAVSRCRAHVPEAIYIAASLLGSLADVLVEVFKTKPDDAPPADLADDPTQPAVADAQPAAGTGGGEVEDGAMEAEFPLQGFLEGLLSSFEPEEGYEEVEMERVERLVGELARARLFDHDRWVHKLIARGVFERVGPGRPADAAAVKHQRLLAHLPSYPEARIDHCQRRILLQDVAVLDLEPCAELYAHKINRFLWSSLADLSDRTLRAAPAAHALDQLQNLPEHTRTVGSLDVERIHAIEWEEAVNLAWLLHERGQHNSGAFTDGVLAARGQAVVFNSLCAVLADVPMYIKAQLSHHIATTLKVAVDRGRYEAELVLVEGAAIPADAELSEEVLLRAVVLLESTGDLRTLVHTLCWLLDHAPSACAAMTLLAHLRTVRATGLSQQVWSTALATLGREEAAGRAEAAGAVVELMSGMLRQASEAEAKALEESLQRAVEAARPGGHVAGMNKVLEAVGKGDKEAEAAAAPGSEDTDLSELAKGGEQRPELVEAVDQVLVGGQRCAEAAEGIAKQLAGGAGAGLLAVTVLRAAVNGTLQEVRAGYKFGCSGYAISRCVSLVAALKGRGAGRLPQMLLQIIMEHAEAVLGAAQSEDTSPVDTPQAQTPFSPATPDSVPVPPPAVRPAEWADLRQDATLALVGVLLARGTLLWREVEGAVKQRLESVVKDKKQSSPARLLLNLVELLLTDRRRGAAALMPRPDWCRLKVLRQTQPTHTDVYLMLKYIVQLAVFVGGAWKQPALACIQQVVQDGGFCRLAMNDDPQAFLKECCRPCMSILRAEPDLASPFRFFTFLPQDHANKLPAGPVAALQEVMSRKRRWSVSFDCRELRILVDAWKREIADLAAASAELNSWRALRTHPGVEAGALQAFEEALQPGDFEPPEKAEDSFHAAFERAPDKLMEHHMVDMLLARLWRAPEEVSHVALLAKSLGLCFEDKDGMDGGVWFEAQMVQVLLAVMGSRPVARARVSLDAFFRDFLHPSALPAGEPSPPLCRSARHRSRFHRAVVLLFSSCALPPSDRPPATLRPEVARLRGDAAARLVAQLAQAADLAHRPDLAAGPAGEAGAAGRRPGMQQLQRLVVLRAECLAGLLAVLCDDAPETAAVLRSALDALQALLSSAPLLAGPGGERVYRAVTALVDAVGSQRDPHLRGGGPRMSAWFKGEAQTLLLAARLPRAVAAQLSCDLPLRHVSLTSGGFVRRPAADTAGGELAGAEGRKGLESAVDVDPWLLLEEFSGVLGRHLGAARKRPRKRLEFEYASQQQLEHERRQQEELMAAQQQAALAAQVAAAPPPPAAPAALDDPEMELGGVGEVQMPEAPMSLGNDNGSWGGWTDLGGDGGNFLMDLDL